MHGYDVVYRRPCCVVTVTVGGTPNGDEAYAEAEVIRLLRKLCTRLATDELVVQHVPSQWSYAHPGGKAVAKRMSP